METFEGKESSIWWNIKLVTDVDFNGVDLVTYFGLKLCVKSVENLVKSNNAGLGLETTQSVK